jgi:hypothetical protein
MSNLKKEVVELKEEKLDEDLYRDEHKKAMSELETVKYSSEDNFRNQLGTDNYIEKYLPFTI